MPDALEMTNRDTIRVLRVMPVMGTGGTELQCVEVLEELHAQRERHGIAPELIAIYRPRTEVFRRPAGVPFRCLEHPRTSLGMLRAVRDLGQLIGDYDCIHALLWPAIWAAVLAGRHGPPLVASFHGSRMAPGIFQLKRALDRRLATRAAQLVAISNTGRSALAAYLGVAERDVAVIANGKRPYSGPRPARRGVVCLARTFAPKRHDLLLDALALLPQENRPPATLIGLGTDSRRLTAAAARRGLNNLRLVGQVLDPLPYVVGAEVLALPTEHEGLANAILEAWSTGTPVIASRVVGVQELVRDGVDGMLVANTPQDWAAGLAQLLGDRQLRESLARAGGERMASAFSLAETAAAWAQLYRDVVRTGQKGRRDA